MILINSCSGHSYILLLLWQGMTRVTFHCLGVIPLLKRSRNNLANGLAGSGAACFKTLAGIESGQICLFNVKRL